MRSSYIRVMGVLALAVMVATSAHDANAFGGLGLIKKLRNRDSAPATGSLDTEQKLTYGERDLYVHVPNNLPPYGHRALVLVMHGGLGNAERIVTKRSEKGLNLDEMADKYGYIVAYINGTRVAGIFGDDKKGWNAGYCCGKPAQDKVDDVSYITGLTTYLSREYGINQRRIYGIGHSNGAMMTQRVICEAGLFAKGISVSGVLNVETTSCPGAGGRTILEVHGRGDKAVPIEGGYGEGVSDKNYKKPQSYAKHLIEEAGGSYILQIYDEGAEHQFDTITNAVLKQDGITFEQKVSNFFDLSN